MAQLASARLSEREVPNPILGGLNVCFDFPLIRISVNLQIPVKWSTARERGIKGALLASIHTSFITDGTTDVK